LALICAIHASLPLAGGRSSAQASARWAKVRPTVGVPALRKAFRSIRFLTSPQYARAPRARPSAYSKPYGGPFFRKRRRKRASPSAQACGGWARAARRRPAPHRRTRPRA
jgi:hypothetical protein